MYTNSKIYIMLGLIPISWKLIGIYIVIGNTLKILRIVQIISVNWKDKFAQ